MLLFTLTETLFEGLLVLLQLGVVEIFIQILQHLVVVVTFGLFCFNFAKILLIIQGGHIMKTEPKMLLLPFITVVNIISSLV